MTNELEITLQDIEAKAERKREVLSMLDNTSSFTLDVLDFVRDKVASSKLTKDGGLIVMSDTKYRFDAIRKYIEEN
jgi:hypothetical protein